MSDLETGKILPISTQEKRRNRAIKWMKIFYIPCVLVLICDLIVLGYLFLTKNQSVDELFASTIFSLFFSISFIFYLVALLIGAIFFLQWIYGAYKNLEFTGIKQNHSPSMAIWGFIIPIVNIIYPWKILKELLNKMSEYIDIKSPSLDKTIYQWVVLFVSGMELNRQSYKIPDDTYNQLLIGWSLDLGAKIVWILCTFIVIRMLAQMGEVESKFLEKIGIKEDDSPPKSIFKSFSLSGLMGIFGSFLFIINSTVVYLYFFITNSEPEMVDNIYLTIFTVIGSFIVPGIVVFLSFIDLLRFLYNLIFKKYKNQMLLNSLVLNSILIIATLLIGFFFMGL